MRGVGVCLLLALLLAGCSSATTSRGTETRGSNVLSGAQLTATNSSSLYDALAKLRPEWLSSRGPSSASDPTPTAASVFMGGTLLGKTDELRLIRVIDVTEVRYWNAGQASARFGMGHPRGVIEIVRK